MLKYRTNYLRIFLIVVCTVYLGDVGLVSHQAMAMTEEEEIKIGEEAHKQILQQYRVYDNKDLQNYVQFIGKKLAEKSARPHLDYSFLVLDSEEVNAFALPGGYIYLTRGIMAYLKSEAKLAAVLGHEIGHVAAQHAIRQKSASQAANLGSTLVAILGALYVPGLDPNISSDLLGIGSDALLKGYGRDHELQADELGAEYMAKSSYDTQAIMDVVTTLKNHESYEYRLARLEGRKPRVYHGLFASHPDNDKRLQEAIKNADNFKTDDPVYKGVDTYMNLIINAFMEVGLWFFERQKIHDLDASTSRFVFDSNERLILEKRDRLKEFSSDELVDLLTNELVNTIHSRVLIKDVQKS